MCTSIKKGLVYRKPKEDTNCSSCNNEDFHSVAHQNVRSYPYESCRSQATANAWMSADWHFLHLKFLLMLFSIQLNIHDCLFSLQVGDLMRSLTVLLYKPDQPELDEVRHSLHISMCMTSSFCGNVSIRLLVTTIVGGCRLSRSLMTILFWVLRIHTIFSHARRIGDITSTMKHSLVASQWDFLQRCNKWWWPAASSWYRILTHWRVCQRFPPWYAETSIEYSDHWFQLCLLSCLCYYCYL